MDVITTMIINYRIQPRNEPTRNRQPETESLRVSIASKCRSYIIVILYCCLLFVSEKKHVESLKF